MQEFTKQMAAVGSYGALAASMQCQDCESEVLITRGARRDNIRVVHEDTCPWWARYQAREVLGRVPCRCRVTHRGPYQRKAAK